MTSPINIIINRGSGKDDNADEIKSELIKLFNEHNLNAEVSIAESGEDILRLVETALKSDAEIIVAGGGDGTISAVAGKIFKTNKTLGILPLGTLNNFSKDLKIPQNLPEAVSVIAENYTTKIDAAEVNGQIFINNSSIGLYPHIVKRREKQQRLGHGKWSAAFWAATAVLRLYPFLNLKLLIDGKEISRRTPFVFIGNNEYDMDSFSIGSRKTLQDGKLSVYILCRTGRLGLVRLALRSIFGRLRQAKDFETFCTDEIRIETHHKKLLVAFDGEVREMKTPLSYKILPQALRVIVPKEEN